MSLEKNTLVGGRYRIIEKLGEGGFGETYKAEDTYRMGETVVVKRLKIESFSREDLTTAKELFESEAKSLKQLGSHPQIPKLEAYFEEKTDFYLVMEYIAEKNLSEQELKQGSQLEEGEVINLLKSILKILQVIHSKNLIHRDIKPNNLIRRSIDQQIVLIDFGCVTNDLNIQNQNQANGKRTLTVSFYAAPEQCYGQAYPCSDIYAVGMIGIQALTGRLPNELPRDQITDEILWKHLTKASKRLKKVLKKMICYDVYNRYKTVNEVLKDLDKIGKPRSVAKLVHSIKNLIAQIKKRKVNNFWTTIAVVGIIIIFSFLLKGNTNNLNLLFGDTRIKKIFPPPNVMEVAINAEVRIAGSVAMIAKNNDLKNDFEKDKFPAKINVDLSLYNDKKNRSSDNGIHLLCKEEIEIAASSRPLKYGEKCPTNGKRIFAVQVGTDYLSVYVRRNNPVDNLEKSQIKKIAQCETTEWSVLVRNWPDKNQKNIQFLNRPPESGTHDVFKNKFLDNQPFCSKENPNYSTMIIEIPDEYTQSSQNLTVNQIAYGSYGNTAFSQLKRLSIDGIKPGKKNYLYTRPLFYVYVAEEDGKPESLVVQQFLGFLLNEK
ncbi:MAG: serine/threonine-protein kinase [Nostoc sp. DedQUE12a]|nr:serine/threonine-protein kinase [Nostoc sp. DedQUE12a]